MWGMGVEATGHARGTEAVLSMGEAAGSPAAWGGPGVGCVGTPGAA